MHSGGGYEWCGIQWQAASVLSLSLSLPRARDTGSPSPPRSARVELEHAVTEASSTCFLEIDTLPSHGRHAHHRRPRQPSESRSSPVGDPSCSSSSSLSCSLLLSSTSSSSLPVRARPSFDRVRRLQRGFRCRVMSFRTVNKNPPPPRVVCYFHSSFYFPFLHLPPTRPLFRHFSLRGKILYILKKRARILFLALSLPFLSSPVFFPAKRNQMEEGGEDLTGGGEDRIVNDTARYNDKSPRPYANGRNYKRRAGCSVIILTFNCSIPRDK